jgi:hypothetical protein
MQAREQNRLRLVSLPQFSQALFGFASRFGAMTLLTLAAQELEQNFGLAFLVMNGVWQPAQIAGRSRRIQFSDVLSGDRPPTPEDPDASN